MPRRDSLSRVRAVLREHPEWTVLGDGPMSPDRYEENWAVLATRDQQWFAASFFLSLYGAYTFSGARDEHGILGSVRALTYIIEHPCRGCPGQKPPTWDALLASVNP